MQEQLNQLYGYLHGMWRYRWSALLITWGAALAGWLIVFSLPNQYTANAVIYVDTTSIMRPLLKGIALEVDANDELKVMTHVLLSRENLLSVIRETDMDLGLDSPIDKERLLKKLTKDITVKGGERRDRSNIYAISYKGSTADNAYKVVSNLLNTMIENTLNSSRTDTASAQKFLDTQIAEYEKRLSKSEQKLAAFKKANIGYMPDEKGNYYSRLQGAQEKVENTRSNLKLAKQRYIELNKQIKDENPVLDGDTYQTAYMIKMRKYQAQLADLLQVDTEQHPDVLALKAKIVDLKANQKSASGDIKKNDDGISIEFNPVYQEMKVQLSKASVDLSILKIQLSDQRAYVKKLKGSIDVIPEVEAKLTKLNRDYAVTKARYLDLVGRRESAKLAQDADQSTSNIQFRVIDSPIIPLQPSGPPRLLLLAAVLVFALAAGLAWGFLRFMLAPTFLDLKQISEKTGFPVLGTVSLYLSPQHKIRRKWQLTSFLSAICLLVFVFGGAIVFKQQGVNAMGAAMTDVHQQLRGFNHD